MDFFNKKEEKLLEQAKESLETGNLVAITNSLSLDKPSPKFRYTFIPKVLLSLVYLGVIPEVEVKVTPGSDNCSFEIIVKDSSCNFRVVDHFKVNEPDGNKVSSKSIKEAFRRHLTDLGFSLLVVDKLCTIAKYPKINNSILSSFEAIKAFSDSLGYYSKNWGDGFDKNKNLIKTIEKYFKGFN